MLINILTEMWREALSVIPIQKRDPLRFCYPAQLKNSDKNYSGISPKKRGININTLSQPNSS